MYNIVLVFTFLCFSHSVFSQRAPPGVNPQHYQTQYQQPPQYQQVPQQQYQQQQNIPQQQIPVQQQAPAQPQYQHQVPVQQQYQQAPVQQQVPQQQLPVQHQPSGHNHGHDHGQRQLFNSGNIAHEKEHIQEHLEVPIDTSKMTEQELQFHYFKMHDADNNNKLDGCELIKSLIHWHVADARTPNERTIGLSYEDHALAEMVDDFLKFTDFNNDGFVDWIEYNQATFK